MDLNNQIYRSLSGYYRDGPTMYLSLLHSPLLHSPHFKVIMSPTYTLSVCNMINYGMCSFMRVRMDTAVTLSLYWYANDMQIR